MILVHIVLYDPYIIYESYYLKYIFAFMDFYKNI